MLLEINYTESANISENVSEEKRLGYKVSYTESANINESVSKELILFRKLNFSETANIEETVTGIPKTYEESKEEEINCSDSVLIEKRAVVKLSYSETANINESVSKELILFRKLNFSETANIEEIVSAEKEGVYEGNPVEEISSNDELTLQVLHTFQENFLEDVALVEEKEIYYDYYYEESGSSEYVCRVNSDMICDALKYAIVDYLRNADIKLLLGDGIMEVASKEVEKSEDGVLLRVSGNFEAKYDKKILKGIEIGDLKYNGLNIEIEGGYMYKLELKFSVNELVECLGGIYNA